MSRSKAGQYDLVFVEEAGVRREIQWRDEDNNIVDLAGYDAQLDVRAFPNASAPALLHLGGKVDVQGAFERDTDADGVADGWHEIAYTGNENTPTYITPADGSEATISHAAADVYRGSSSQHLYYNQTATEFTYGIRTADFIPWTASQPIGVKWARKKDTLDGAAELLEVAAFWFYDDASNFLGAVLTLMSPTGDDWEAVSSPMSAFQNLPEGIAKIKVGVLLDYNPSGPTPYIWDYFIDDFEVFIGPGGDLTNWPETGVYVESGADSHVKVWVHPSNMPAAWLRAKYDLLLTDPYAVTTKLLAGNAIYESTVTEL